MNLLDLLPVKRTRRNHALEHASVHLISAAQPGTPLAGRSTPYGFYIYGNITLELLTEMTHNALERLRGGESKLAIHPGCGTNFLTSGVFAGGAAFATLSVGRDRNRLSRLPDVFVAATLALIIAQPIGPMLQEKVTTLADMGDLEITSVRVLSANGNLKVHYVETMSN
jgi:hypothetical protein